MDMDMGSPFRSWSGCVSQKTADNLEPDNGFTVFGKLSRGDAGYGGNAFCGVGDSPISPRSGLLARRLQGLDVEPDADALP